MGGSAYLIWGRIDEDTFRAAQPKSGLLRRLLGRGSAEPTISSMGNMEMRHMPSEAFTPVANEFLSFVRETFHSSRPVEQGMLDYLDIGIINMYVRGERRPEEKEFRDYVQITFSGCAGMAEVSAELAAHWAQIWYERNTAHIDERLLIPRGLTPDPSIQDPPDTRQFLPLEGLGYALFTNPDPAIMDTEWEGSRLFEFDAAVVDPLYEEGKVDELREIDERYGPLMADGACLCPLCSPDFDVNSLMPVPGVE